MFGLILLISQQLDNIETNRYPFECIVESARYFFWICYLYLLIKHIKFFAITTILFYTYTFLVKRLIDIFWTTSPLFSPIWVFIWMNTYCNGRDLEYLNSWFRFSRVVRCCFVLGELRVVGKRDTVLIMCQSSENIYYVW